MDVIPSGEQYEIRHGDQVAVVVQVGGGLRSYDVGGRAVVDAYLEQARPDGGRGQILAPWPNRIRDGRYSWAGANQQLALSEVEAHNAIHGLVRWTEWSLLDRSDTAVSLTVRVWPQPGYPFRLDVSAHYELTDSGLAVTLTGVNAGSEPVPYGVGQHPYVTAGTALVDDVLLTVPAEEWLRTDDRGLPTGTEPVAGTAYDFRTAREIRDTRLDTAYCSLNKDNDGRVVVHLTTADRSRGVDLWLGEGAEFLQIYTGDTLAPGRRRQGIAIEPMSCPGDAFNSGTGLVTLEPGTSHTLRWGLAAW
ncbi:MAG: aldose 1-epimerase family protein [Candidatus Nanopelagicales bacterium]